MAAYIRLNVVSDAKIRNRLLHPIGHGNRADVSAFPDEVNYGPVVFAALNVVKGQINEFSSN